ncbi:MAG TPA: glycoside hydrolase family 15 protein [Acidobacteriaceae bacterium]
MQQTIEHHGIIGNMRSAALVTIDGTIDFFCYPSFDSPSVFASLLDEEKGGSFSIHAQLDGVRTRQMYLPDTNVLLTRFLAEDGVAELTDYMPVTDIEAPTDDAHQIVRMVRVIRGKVPFRLTCAPRFDYGRAAHTACVEADSICFYPQGGDTPSMGLYASVPLQVEGHDAVTEFSLSAGESASFAFGKIGSRDAGPRMALIPARIEAQFQETTAFWRAWTTQTKYKGRWREMVSRSALLLKLLTSHEHGSVVAAPTFGLPEKLQGSRNWDYRYTWLRDSSFSMYAFMRLGYTGEADAFTQWIKARLIDGLGNKTDEGPLRIMYRADGGSDLEEITLDHLDGHRDSKPVRIGNQASTQLQLDIYGEMMDAVYLSNKYTNGISHAGWQRILQVMAWLGKNWDRPDEGIWEVRSGRHHFLHSRLMCWVAFDRALRLAQKRSLEAPLKEWYETRDAIHADIFKNFWNDKLQSFVQTRGSDTLDASTLLMPLLRFISPTDPQWLSTMAAIEANLTEDALVYRYTSGNDGVQGSEGSFIACSFWRIECLARQGDVEKARLLFDKMLGYANHLGLYAEELGRSGEQLGNFPQALTHLALISAASYLDRKLSNDGSETWQ